MRRHRFVTCIMPTTTARLKYLPRAIRCFQSQTYPNRELLVLEDGGEGVRESIPPDPRIRYAQASKCPSLGHKRNLAIQMAQGEYVAHWDDDDWSVPERLAVQIDGMVQSGRAVGGFTKLLFWDEPRQRAYRYEGKQNYAPGSTLIYRRDWALANPFQGINAGEDFHFLHPAANKRQFWQTDGLGLMVATNHGGNTCPRDDRTLKQWTAIDRAEIPGDYFTL